MNAEIVERVRGLRIAVVSDVYKLAPHADVLVSQDKAWWKAHPEALSFAGRKFSVNPVDGVEAFEWRDTYPLLTTSSNSGLVACLVAEWMGATEIELYGFDMHGSHYFGDHKPPLKNTTADRFRIMINQFTDWLPRARVINRTPGSALTCFEMVD
jgi:hypothetical protein